MFSGSGANSGGDMPPVPGKPRQQVMAEKILQQSREAENALADALVSLPPSLVVSHAVAASI